MHLVLPSPASTARAPRPVQLAVYLMYAGAVVYLVSGIVGLFSLATAVSALGSALSYPVAVLSIVAPIVLWLWMAWKCKAGRSWARVLSTVFFGLATVLTLTERLHSAWGLLGAILGWLIGLGAVILLWQRSSTSYFRAHSAL